MVWAKERFSRRKHDGGDVGDLVQEALSRLDVSLDEVARVVSNNHHFRVLPYEKSPAQLRWSAALGHIDGGVGSEYNLLRDAQHFELSHHLAHVWSAVAQAPFDDGLVVVMDGMGETYSAMNAAADSGEKNYMHDLKLESDDSWTIPADIKAAAAKAVNDFREGESVYTFRRDREKNTIRLTPVVKRWIEEQSPPTLYNHGFENMMSAGAVYSRVSSNIFGDWNACGKVMGLAPWHTVWNKDNTLPSLMSGSLLKEGGLIVDWEALKMNGKPLAGNKYQLDAGAEGPVEGTDEARDAAALAQSIQLDLERVALQAVKELKLHTGEKNLCFCGGVGLNSVLNGKLTRQLGFEETFVPPYPGDDGIAIGCCAYGLFSEDTQTHTDTAKAPLWKGPLSPYQGPQYTQEEIDDALSAAAPWLDVQNAEGEEELVRMTAEVVAGGSVVAWWQGRSEAGPRALGHRTLLADPRNATMVAHINSNVKGREAFRPFAPSVLAEEASNWFDGIAPFHPETDSEVKWGLKGHVSPYMSLTVHVKEGLWDKIPAVTHVDGTSRLQSVMEQDEPLYYRLIKAFFKLTGVPMVLNTSFNTIKSEPITESPSDGVRSFLHARGSIAMLVMGKYMVRRRECPLKTEQTNAYSRVPLSAGPFVLETSESVSQDGFRDVSRVRIQMASSVMSCDTKDQGWIALTDDLEAEILTNCNGENSVEDIISQLVSEGQGGEEEEEWGEEVSVQDVVDRLTRLYTECLISYV